MTKINDFRNPELTFGELGIEAMFAKLHEGETKMFFMLFLGFGVDKNVIKIYHNELVEVFMKDRVHESRESRRCIGEAKEHDGVLVETVAGENDVFRISSFLIFI